MDTICHIITKLELGGAQEVALYAVSHLDRTRFRPVLLTGPGGLLTEEARRLPGVQTIIVPSLGRRIHAISDLLAFIHLCWLLRRLKPVIVHTHSSKAGILGRWAAWCARVPVILHTMHLLTDVVDTTVLTALVWSGPVSKRRFIDVSENGLYWYFIVVWWIPIYLTVYMAPRWL